MAKMVIRSWDEADLPQVLALLKSLAEKLGDDIAFDPERLRRQFRGMKRKSDVYESFVCEEAGAILGFISLVFYESAFHLKGTSLISELVVAEGARGSGIGERLLRRAVEEAEIREMDEVEVGVMKENEEAIRFYKKRGLVEEYLLLGLDLAGD
jgi:ribosomal protein S18 acetylase RimI-like enzyme